MSYRIIEPLVELSLLFEIVLFVLFMSMLKFSYMQKKKNCEHFIIKEEESPRNHFCFTFLSLLHVRIFGFQR